MNMNPNYATLPEDYLFADIARRVEEYKQLNATADIIRLGIGDVTRPLAKPVVDALVAASTEQGVAETFKGYGPYEGYAFLREAIAAYYAKRGVTLALDEIFVSDGAKSDLGNVLELFTADNTVLIPDPVYPAYVDANLLDGRKIEYVAGNGDNCFLPMPPHGVKADIIYICSPNNPTGSVYSKEQLAVWVDYALENDAVILFDAAYEAFIDSPEVPRSIFEIEGAKECAIEVCSLSKTAGFTGTRCGYTVIPQALKRGAASINKMWLRRQTTKYNGVPYIVQCAAAAVFTEEGLQACMQNIAYYKNNALVIGAALDELGIEYCGGICSPYIWLQCPGGMKSWDFFDLLLTKAQVVGTPGAGFGKNGEGYFRLTGFGDAARTQEAVQRMKKLLGNI